MVNELILYCHIFTTQIKTQKTMKKVLTYTLLLLCLFTATYTQAALPSTTPKDTLSAASKAELLTIQVRLQAIKDMPKGNLTVTEKKALRQEVKQSKKRANELSKGVYLSVGAIIIIILLLILIL